MPDDASSSGMSENAGVGAASIGPELAHDLSNILAAALAAARLLQRKTDTDETRELAEIVLRQLDKAVNSIHEASN